MNHKVLCPFCRVQVPTDKRGRRIAHIYYHEAGRSRCWGSEVEDTEAAKS